MHLVSFLDWPSLQLLYGFEERWPALVVFAEEALEGDSPQAPRGSIVIVLLRLLDFLWMWRTQCCTNPRRLAAWIL